jgi:hypothetical protein
VLRDGMVELATPNICGGIAGPGARPAERLDDGAARGAAGQRFGSVRVENDCVAALEAERHWGALKGLDHCAYVTWSTGVGTGLCVDGRVLRGKNGNAGHAGHMFVSDNDDALCGCGNVGDVEALVAGNAMARRFGSRRGDLLQRAPRASRKCAGARSTRCAASWAACSTTWSSRSTCSASAWAAACSGTTATSCCRACRRRSTAQLLVPAARRRRLRGAAAGAASPAWASVGCRRGDYAAQLALLLA